MSDQFISKTSQIQFFLSLTCSGFNLPLILNKCILLATLHSFIGTYEVGIGYIEQDLGIIRKQTSFTKAGFSYFVSN